MFTICVLQRASYQRVPTQNQNESINNIYNMIWSNCLKRVCVAKADLSFMESLNVKSGPIVIAGLKCKMQNNKKI